MHKIDAKHEGNDEGGCYKLEVSPLFLCSLLTPPPHPQELEQGGDDVRDVIFDEVIQHIAELMGDPFGNYLCQKLIARATPAQRLAIMQGCVDALEP